MAHNGYEAHITFSKDHADFVRRCAAELEWKFSQIDGDPVLGDKVFCYLSAHDDSQMRLMQRMGDVVEKLKPFGIIPLRTKIEEILYDKLW
jgi:hypothetical protein